MADQLRVVLAQPVTRSGDFCTDLDNLFAKQDVAQCDVLVLPELIGSGAEKAVYEYNISKLARELGCYVVGGSYHSLFDHGVVNSGVVADRLGSIVAHYEKVRPYGSELDKGTIGGNGIGQFSIEERTFVVLICADLWFSDTFSQLDVTPDAIFVPSFSITQKPDPKPARQLWKHMAVARAYEYAAYVGVSDWNPQCKLDGLSAAGVSGIANPIADGDRFYASNKRQKLRMYELDFARLDAFRANRAMRGFLGEPATKHASG